MAIREQYKVLGSHNENFNHGHELFELGIGTSYRYALPFVLESDRFVLTENMEDADIVPVFHQLWWEQIPVKYQTILKEKIIIFCTYFHSSDYDYTFDPVSLYHNWKTHCPLVFDAPVNFIENTSETMPYDLMWNRSKIYYTDYHRIPLRGRQWSETTTEKMYKLTEIAKVDADKIFLCPNRVENWPEESTDENRRRNNGELHDGKLKDRLIYRKFLHAHLNEDTTYYSNFFTSPKKYLMHEEEDSEVYRGFAQSIDESAEGQLKFGIKESGDITSLLHGKSLWMPISNKLYNKTFISVYVESIVTSMHVRSLSEKTFDPLIKGHFILPYSYCGMTKDLCNLGFLLPDWINYEYDSIEDSDTRFEEFIKEYHRLNSLSLDTYFKYFEKDYKILTHNRNVFFTRPYDSLYSSLIRTLKKHYEV